MQTEKLESLLQKLKANKEKVPLEVLKTKYKAAYEQLVEEIRSEGIKCVEHIVLKTPEWLKEIPVTEEQVCMISEIWDSVFAEGNYAKKLGRALYKEYSTDEVIRIANELRTIFLERLEQYLRNDDGEKKIQ